MAFTRSSGSFATLGFALCLTGCADDSSSDDAADSGLPTSASDAGTAGATGETDASDDTSPGSMGGQSSESESASNTGSETSGAGDESTGDEVHDDCNFSEDFEGLADGDPWPDVWVIDGGVAAADIRGGRGRLQASISSYSLARISVRLDCTEIDASVTFQFTDASTQGAALYARTNGGYLRDTTPTGEGYAAFAELFRNPGALGVWREVDGREQQITSAAFELQPNVDYRMRFRLTQQSASESLLQTKIWQLGTDEPSAWMVERTDNTASLQGVGGGIALDAWSSEPLSTGAGADLFFDDLVVQPAR